MHLNRVEDDALDGRTDARALEFVANGVFECGEPVVVLYAVDPEV